MVEGNGCSRVVKERSRSGLPTELRRTRRAENGLRQGVGVRRPTANLAIQKLIGDVWLNQRLGQPEQVARSHDNAALNHRDRERAQLIQPLTVCSGTLQERRSLRDRQEVVWGFRHSNNLTPPWNLTEPPDRAAGPALTRPSRSLRRDAGTTPIAPPRFGSGAQDTRARPPRRAGAAGRIGCRRSAAMRVSVSPWPCTRSFGRASLGSRPRPSAPPAPLGVWRQTAARGTRPPPPRPRPSARPAPDRCAPRDLSFLEGGRHNVR